MNGSGQIPAVMKNTFSQWSPLKQEMGECKSRVHG